MRQYGYTEKYLTMDGLPWFPVMGEMHYSRYREDLWEESLRKMKAGGVTVLSTYVIWIHHEEEEDSFDFTGCRNLGRFIRICKKVGLSMFLRLGPWIHGEVRNGGFPDWLQQKEREGVILRSNDERYLRYVRRFWEKVYEQAEGYFHKDGGPIMGVQIENEYGHVGGLKGEAGETHMRTLTSLAKELGFIVPYYTATGWGGACIGDLLPVMGGYCEAPWDQRTTELEANANYVFSSERNDALIACDHHVGDQVTFDQTRFPFLTAELGGGLQVTKHRRPVAHGKDIGAMSLTKLGSGVALLGYYMYHGGSNPKGKLSTLQESRETGYLNDLPEVNYDFNAPVRQYGAISDSYREIKLLAYFLKDFGDDMAALETDILTRGVKPEDTKTLRLSSRHDDEHGYVFYNNYQRRRVMDAHQRTMLIGKCRQPVNFPPVDIGEGAFGFFPYRMRLGNAVLRSALATPLCCLHTKKENIFVFYGEQEPEYQWEGEEQARVLSLSREQALNAWKVTLDQDYLILSENYVWEEDGVLKITGAEETEIRCFPEAEEGIPGFVKYRQEAEFTVYRRKAEYISPKIEVNLTAEDRENRVYDIQIVYGEREDRRKGRDTILYLEYAGESLEIYADGEKLNVHLYTGQKVPLSLGYFDFPKQLRVIVHSLFAEDDIFLEKCPVFIEDRACSLISVKAAEEFR